MKRLTRRVASSLLWLLAGAGVAAHAQDGTAQEGEAAAPAAASSAVSGAPKYSAKGADSCIKCHDDPEVLVLFKTRHGRRSDERTPFGHGQLQCEACHGPGGAHAARIRSGQDRPAIPHFGSTSTSSATERNRMCLGCHQAGMSHGWQGSSHEREGLACADCHRMHAAKDPMFSEADQPEVCFGCHKQQRAQVHLPYSHPIRQGELACSGCHNPHGTMTDFNLVKRSVNETCYTCHADKRGPFLWEHEPVAEDCTICHKPHGSSQPALLTRRAPILCQQCHSQQGHPSTAASPSSLPGGTPSAAVLGQPCVNCSVALLGQGCVNCHSQVHGSNHPSGAKLMR